MKKFTLILLIVFLFPVIAEGKSNIIAEIKPMEVIEVEEGDYEFTLPSYAVGLTEDGDEVKLMLNWSLAMNDFGGQAGQTYTLYPQIYGNSASEYKLKSGVGVSVNVKVLGDDLSADNIYTFESDNVSTNPEIEISMTIGSNNFNITENGINKVIQMDTEIIYNDNQSSMMFPARFVSEALGYNVEFIADSELVIISKPTRRIVLQLWKATMLINDTIFQMITPAVNYNSRTYIPIRAVAESMDFNVSWDVQMQTAILRNY